MMASEDKIIALIDGRQYEVIAGRLSALENDNRQIHEEIREIRTELKLLVSEFRGMNNRLEDMKSFMSLTFGAVAIFVAVVTLSPIVSKLIDIWQKPHDDENIRVIVRDEFSRLNVGGDKPA